jgi:N-carbamoyl-L-amino-acid hydrolase
MGFEEMWRDLVPIGRDPDTGGYHRSPFASAERECLAWYADQAASRGLDIERDGQGNLVAWWRPAGVSGKAILLGSHLDSVESGGAFDGPLGVVSAFAAVDVLRDRGTIPSRPIGIAVFVEEEGSRFGIACLGSRLATGLLAPDRAAGLTDRGGVRLTDAMSGAGLDPRLGPSPLLADVGMFVELHVEQGRDLVDRGTPVGVAAASWAHGRWRLDFTGEANHAGTTRMQDRHDPMLTYAMTALAANKQARLADARATFGRVAVEPNSTNSVAAGVRAWLDARAPEVSEVERLVGEIARQATDRAGRDGTTVEITAESVSPRVDFDPDLAARLSTVLGGVPVLPTGAGHDAAILQSAGIPSAMLFVRNPTGVSHAPSEFAEMPDCLAGVEALAAVVAELAA